MTGRSWTKRLAQALIKSLEWDDKIPTGVFYRNDHISPHEQRITERVPGYLENPPARQTVSHDGSPLTDVESILDSMEV